MARVAPGQRRFSGLAEGGGGESLPGSAHGPRPAAHAHNADAVQPVVQHHEIGLRPGLDPADAVVLAESASAVRGRDGGELDEAGTRKPGIPLRRLRHGQRATRERLRPPQEDRPVADVYRTAPDSYWPSGAPAQVAASVTRTRRSGPTSWRNMRQNTGPTCTPSQMSSQKAPVSTIASITPGDRWRTGRIPLKVCVTVRAPA